LFLELHMLDCSGGVGLDFWSVLLFNVLDSILSMSI